MKTSTPVKKLIAGIRAHEGNKRRSALELAFLAGDCIAEELQNGKYKGSLANCANEVGGIITRAIGNGKMYSYSWLVKSHAMAKAFSEDHRSILLDATVPREYARIKLMPMKKEARDKTIQKIKDGSLANFKLAKGKASSSAPANRENHDLGTTARGIVFDHDFDRDSYKISALSLLSQNRTRVDVIMDILREAREELGI